MSTSSTLHDMKYHIGSVTRLDAIVVSGFAYVVSLNHELLRYVVVGKSFPLDVLQTPWVRKLLQGVFRAATGAATLLMPLNQVPALVRVNHHTLRGQIARRYSNAF
jgi:hypothetical protein